jgi:hypothetical protein
MKKYIICFLALFNLLIAFSQNIEVKKSDNHILTEGTQIFLIPPTNFTTSSQFQGFENNKNSSSIVFFQVASTFENLLKIHSNENLTKKGIEIITKKDFSLNNHEGQLIEAKQFSKKHKITFNQFYFLLKLDNNKSLLVTANYPETESNNLKEKLKESLFTIYYDESVKLEQNYTFDFDVDISKSTFIKKDLIKGSIFLDGGSKGICIISKSIRYIDSSDKKKASVEIIKKLSQFNFQNLDSFEEIIIGDNKAYKSIGNLIDKNNIQKKYIQTIIFDNNNYYNITAILPKITDEITKEYNYIMNSFKIK